MINGVLNINLQEEQDYLNGWLINRLNFLDVYYSEL